MNILQRLRAMVAPLPPGSMVNLPADWLRGELDRVREGGEDGSEGDKRRDNYTVQQAAKHFRRSPSTVRGWLAEGLFPGAFKFRGREWLIPASDVDALLSTQAAKPAAIEEEPQGFGSDDLASWRTVRKEAA